MVDLATISAAISAATSAVGFFDKFADQVEHFIRKNEKPLVPKEHRSNEDYRETEYNRFAGAWEGNSTSKRQ